MKEVADLKRYSSPTEMPQALAWDGKQMWTRSRDLGTLYRTERNNRQPPLLSHRGHTTRDGGD